MAARRALQFLSEHHKKGAPLALALSGGPDSMALLHLLLDFRRKNPFELHLIHVDHGWRKESYREAEELRALSSQLALPFHLKKLEEMPLCDAENHCRNERLLFFLEVAQKTGAEAVCLGHHRDDVAETVLKRIFEGARLERLGAFGFEKCLSGLKLWRPWITTSKSEILAYLDGRLAFYDATNSDSRFLRARLRKTIIPTLEREFGKGIGNNLLRLGRQADLLKHYLEKVCSKWLGRRGDCCYYGDFKGAHLLEIEYVLSQLGNFSREAIGNAAALLQGGAPHRSVMLGEKQAVIHRGSLLLLDPPAQGYLGPWEVLEETEIRAAPPWHRLWTEGGYWPIGEGEVVLVDQLETKGRRRLMETPLFKQIPRVLRGQLPYAEGPFKRSLFLKYQPAVGHLLLTKK